MNSKPELSSRIAGAFLAAAAAFLSAGCGGDSGPPPSSRADVSGTVTFDGQKVAAGVVTFQHESGQVAACPISDGTYTNREGEGAIPGKNRVSIAGYAAPNGAPLWSGPWQAMVEVPAEGTKKDFTISKTEVKPPNTKTATTDPGDL